MEEGEEEEEPAMPSCDREREREGERERSLLTIKGREQTLVLQSTAPVQLLLPCPRSCHHTRINSRDCLCAYGGRPRQMLYLPVPGSQLYKHVPPT